MRYKSLLWFVGFIFILWYLISALRRFINNTSKPHTDIQHAKHITVDGIYPLPKHRTYPNVKQNDSVIPLRFFKNNNGKSLHNFRWLLNPDTKCFDELNQQIDVFLVVAIASAAWEFDRREIIRTTWASRLKIQGKNIVYVFFVGNDGKSQDRLKFEFANHQDLVFEDFQETYKNLTIKTQGQLKWATYFCPHAKYVMHVDDDVFVDIESVVNYMIKQTDYQRQLYCARLFKPKVRREGKWEMSRRDYPGGQYPLSCVGWCFVMSMDVVVDLYMVSTNTHLIHLEDVTFTGILREKIGDLPIHKLPSGDLVCQHKGWPKDRPTNDKLLEAWKQLHVVGPI